MATLAQTELNQQRRHFHLVFSDVYCSLFKTVQSDVEGVSAVTRQRSRAICDITAER